MGLFFIIVVLFTFLQLFSLFLGSSQFLKNFSSDMNSFLINSGLELNTGSL